MEMASKLEHAYHRLKSMLVQLEIEPGAVLDDQHLSAMLQVGRTPIREALQRLAAEGLVEVVPRRGTFAAQISVGDVKQLYETRIGLEGYAARLAAQKVTQGDLDELEALIELAQAAVACGDVIEIARVDTLLHRRLWAVAHNRFLQAALDSNYTLGRRVWYYTYRHGLHANAHFDMVTEWIGIVAALKQRDGEAVQKAMEAHVAHLSQIVMDSNWFKHPTVT